MLSQEQLFDLKSLLFEAYGYKIYEQPVADFHLSNARTKIISCPARTSKSYAGWKDALPDVFVPWAELGQGKQEVDSVIIWIAAPNYALAKEFDYAWNDLVERRSTLGFDYKLVQKSRSVSQGNMRIQILWGKDSRGNDVTTTVEVKSAFNEQSLQSEEVDVVIMSEAARLPEISWRKYLSTRAGRSIWPTTPDIQAAWIYKEIEQGKADPKRGVVNFQFTGRANPTYRWDRYWVEHRKAESLVGSCLVETEPLNEKERPSATNGHDCFDPLVGCRAMKEDGFAEQFGGLWVFHRGRVMPIRAEESAAGAPAHVINYDFDWMRDAFWTVSCDYGYADGACAGFWATGPNKQLVLRDCVYEKQLNPDEFVGQILEVWKRICERFDMYGRVLPDRCVGDPKKPEVADLMRGRGLPVWDVDKRAQASRHAGHQELMSYLATDAATGLPRMLIHTDCSPVINEWLELRRNDRVRDEGSPTAFIGDDHAYDMARYFVMSKPVESVSAPSVDSFDSARRQIIRERKRRPVVPTVPPSMQPVRWRGAA